MPGTAQRRWHADIATRLQAGDPAALMELYDATSATVYAYALRALSSCHDACQATWNAYLTVWQAPQLLSDVRVPVEVRLASLIRSAPAMGGMPRPDSGAAESVRQPALKIAI